jgi:hypothetical protein
MKQKNEKISEMEKTLLETSNKLKCNMTLLFSIRDTCNTSRRVLGSLFFQNITKNALVGLVTFWLGVITNLSLTMKQKNEKISEMEKTLLETSNKLREAEDSLKQRQVYTG